MKFCLLLVIIFSCPFFIKAQNEPTNNNAEKAKSRGLVIVGLTNNRTVENQFNERITVPEDFLNIAISGNVLKPLDENILTDDKSQYLSEKNINKLFNNNKIGQQIISYWFARQQNGIFDPELIKEKQLLDIYKTVSLIQKEGKKDVFLKNIDGLDIVNESYILLIDFKRIQTMEEYYNENGIENKSRILSGFISDFDYYLIKLDFNNRVASHFFNNYWLTKDTEQKLDKKQQFATADFPFVLISTGSDQVASVQQVQELDRETQEDKDLNKSLLGQLVELVSNKAVLNIENEDVFYKYNRIQTIKPIGASMGLDEGLKFDRRYLVFVNQINKSGKVEKKKIGVVKSMKIVDSTESKNSINDLSEFYQIGGKKISSSGMYLKKKSDLGINIGVDRVVLGSPNTSGRIEYYFSKLFDGTIPPGKRAKGSTSLKIYFEGAYNDGTYKFEDAARKFEFRKGIIGLSKDFYPYRKLHWSPFVGYGIESAKYEGSDKLISTNFVETGLRLGINIFYNVQFIGTLKDNFLIKSVLLDGEREVLNEDFGYVQTFSNRKGVSFGLGFRIML